MEEKEFIKFLKSIKIEKSDKPVITVNDMVLILLYAQKKPIIGRILLFKEVFLLYFEILKKYESLFKLEDPKFVPYKYGPYSFDLAEILENMEWFGYIKREGRKNTRTEKFYITNKGAEFIKPLFDSLPKQLKNEIMEKRKGWDQLGIDGILKYVYTYYPEFKEKSKIKEKYKDIFWGCGIA